MGWSVTQQFLYTLQKQEAYFSEYEQFADFIEHIWTFKN